MTQDNYTLQRLTRNAPARARVGTTPFAEATCTQRPRNCSKSDECKPPVSVCVHAASLYGHSRMDGARPVKWRQDASSGIGSPVKEPDMTRKRVCMS